MIDSLERRVLLDGTPLSVVIGDQSGDQGTTMHYADADGTHIYSTVKHGSATFVFDGDGLYIAYMKTTICIYGVKITMRSLTIDAGSPSTFINFTGSGGDKWGTLGSFNSSFPIGGVSAPNINLIGPMSLDGGVAGNLNFGMATGSTMSIGGMMPLGNLGFGTLTDSTFSTTNPVKSFSAKSWTHPTITPNYGFTAGSVGKFSIGSSFSEGLNLTGGGTALGTAMINGTLGGNWNITGNSNYMGAVNVDPNFHLIQAGYNESFKSKGNAGGSYTVGSFGQFNIGGSLTGANLNLTYPYTSTGYDLGKFTVKGPITGLNLYSVGSIQSFKSGNLIDSTIDLGTRSGFSSQSLAIDGDLTNHSWMQNINVTRFQNSYLNAYDISKAKFGMLPLGNNGNPFGISTSSLGQLTAKTDSKQSLSLKNVPLGLSLSDQYTKEKIDPRDFRLSVLNQF